MKKIYLREPERPFKLWKWLVFGPIILFTLDYVAFRLDDVKILQLSIVLGFLITVRMIGIRTLTWGARLLGGIGLSLAISFIASIYLSGFCITKPLLELCTPNHFRVHVFGNFTFPLIIVIVWVAAVIFGEVGKTVSYVIRYWKM
jgi:hypothetical protein